MLFLNKKKSLVQAKLTSRVLLVSIESADLPLVWQWDVEKNHTYVATLRRCESGWDLGVVLPQQEFAQIAHFENYETAETALTVVRQALMKGACQSKRRILRWVVIIALAFLVLRFVPGLMLRLLHAPSSLRQEQMTSETQQPKQVEVLQGVPQAADDVLKAPQP